MDDLKNNFDVDNKIPGKDITNEDLQSKFPLAAKKHSKHKTIIEVGNHQIGGDELIIDDSLKIGDFEYIDTSLEEINDILSFNEADSNISLKITNENLFEISDVPDLINQNSIEEIIASNFKNQNLSQNNNFLF